MFEHVCLPKSSMLSLLCCQVYFVLSGISRTWSWSQVRRMSTFLGGGRFSKSRLGSHWEAGRRSKSSTPSMSRRIRSSGRCPRIVRSIKSPRFYLYLWIFPSHPDMFYVLCFMLCFIQICFIPRHLSCRRGKCFGLSSTLGGKESFEIRIFWISFITFWPLTPPACIYAILIQICIGNFATKSKD